MAKKIIRKPKALKISECFSNGKRSFNVYDQQGKVLKSFLLKKEAEDFASGN